MFNKGSIFNSLFKSYVMIALIPIIAFCALFYKNSISNSREEIEALNTSNLYQIRDSVDIMIKECMNISAQISFNSNLTYYNMVKDDYKVIEGIQELVKLKAGNENLDEVFLYFKNEPSIFSVKGTTSLSVVMEQKYNFSEEEKEIFMDGINNLKAPSLRVFKDSDLIMYMVPLNTKLGVHSSTAIFVFKGITFRKMVSSGNKEFNGATFILDANKNLLFAVDKNELSTIPELVSIVSDNSKAGVNTIKYKNKNYSILTNISPNSGWYYITFMSSDKFWEEVNSMVIFIILCTLLILTICIVVALTMAVNNSRPIKKLNLFIKDNLPQNYDNGTNNEIENISYAVNNAISLNKKLLHQLEDQKVILKQNFLSMLLQGEIKGNNELSKSIEEFDLKLSGPYFAVMIVSFNTSDNEISKLNGSFLEFIRTEYSELGIAYAIEIGHDKSVAVIINIEELGERNTQKKLALEIQGFFDINFSKKAFIGVGKVYSELSKVNNSYIEAKAMLEYRSEMTNQSIFYFEDIVKNSQLNWQSVEDEIFLLHSLREGDKERSFEIIDNVIENIQKKHLHISYIRFSCYRLIDVVMKVFNEIALSDQYEDYKIKYSNIFADVINFPNICEFRVHIFKLVENICSSVHKINEIKEENLKMQLLNFVDQNYKNSNISLDEIACKFGSSNYFWSRFFKNKVGCLFSDYIWRIRVSDAKKQFISSDLPLKNIINDVGYIDVTSFIRRFKSEVGITPGQYRKMYKE